MKSETTTKDIPQTTAAVKPVVIYCRVSTEDQEREGTSLDTQRQACLKYCEQHSYKVIRQFTETCSGLTLDRPQLDELRDLVRNEQITSIVIYCLDRITRDPTHGVILTQELEKHGVKMEAVIENIDNSELGKLISYIRGYAAKLEAEKIRERTQRGIKARVFDKRLPVTYRQPFGYDWDKDSKRLVPNSDYDTVKLILGLAIEGKSYDYIIAELKRRGILSPSGLPEWNKHTISSIVRNPVYCGRYYAFKSEVIEPKKRNGKTNGKTSVKRLPQEQWHYIPEIEVVDPPMTLDQRALLLDQLQKRQKLSKRHAKMDYLLRGLIVCETHQGKNGQPRVYHGIPKRNIYYYTCPVGGCDNPYIDGPWADEIAKLIVRNLLLQPLDSFFQKLTDAETKRDFNNEIKKLEAEYQRLVNKIARLEDDRYEGKIDPDAYQRLSASYSIRKQAIKDAQDKVFDEKALMAHKTEALAGWVKLRGRFLNRLVSGPGLTTEILEKVLRKNPELLPEGPRDETTIKEQAREALRLSQSYTPMTNSEWRELFTACNFQWTILSQDNKQAPMFNGKHARILRRSNFYFDLPIASQKVIKDIALPCPERG